MESMISMSRPGKSWNLSEGHGKSWKSDKIAFRKIIKGQKDKTFEKWQTSQNIILQVLILVQRRIRTFHACVYSLLMTP